MNMNLPETFDPTQQPGNTWELIPVGEYIAEATEGMVAPPKSGNGYMLTLVWKILEGDYENRQVWQTITYLHSNEMAQKIGRKTMKDLCDATGNGGTAVRDISVFLFKPVRIRIGIEKDKNGIYDDKNKVSRIMPLEPNGGPTAPTEAAPPPAKPVAAAATVARPPATSPARPAGTAPWNRPTPR
jgi:Protein of unknown function (DUF669)